MPYDTPVEQWTPAYAAQVQKIMEEGYRQNPDTPEAPATDLVPMGAPEGLNPLVPMSIPETRVSRPSFEGAAAAPQGLPQEAPPSGLVPSSGGFAGSGTWQTIQQMLPMVAAMAYAQNPETRHMAPLALQMGQATQQITGQKELAQIRQQVHQINESQGPEAARQFLGQALGNSRISPSAATVLNKQYEEMTRRKQQTQAIAALATGDHKTKLEAAAALSEGGMDPKMIGELVKLGMPDKRVVQAGNSIFTYDPMNDKLEARAQVPDKFNSAKLGGTDVTQEIRAMGFDPEAISNAADQGDAQAQGVISQAIKSIEQKALEKEERGRKTMLTAADMQAKATQAGMIKSAQIGAEAQAKLNIPVEMVEKGDVVYDVEKAGRAQPYSVTPIDVQKSGGKKVILSGQDYQKVGRIDAAMRNLGKLEQAANKFLGDTPGENLLTTIRTSLQPALADEAVADFQAWQSVVLGLPGLIQGDNRVSNLDLQAASGLRPESWDTKATAQARIKAAKELLNEMRGGILGNPGGGPAPSALGAQTQEAPPKSAEPELIEDPATGLRYRIKR